MNRTMISTLVLSLALASTSGAAPTPEQRCLAGKSKVAGKYYLCLQNASAKLATNGDLAKYSDALNKCNAKYDTGWEKEDEKAMKASTTCYDGGTMDLDFRNFIAANWGGVQSALGGAPLQVCGNGAVEAGEACDVGNLNGKSCETEGFAGGTLGCAPGCTLDKDNLYTWCAPGTFTPCADTDFPPDGTAFTDFLATVNGGVTGVGSCNRDISGTLNGGFAGHCDWRLPTDEELAGILEPGCSSSPCTGIPGFTAPGGYYWTATTQVVFDGLFSLFPADAFLVNLDTGAVTHSLKEGLNYVHAVRGGS
jgi:hypothetical protein